MKIYDYIKQYGIIPGIKRLTKHVLSKLGIKYESYWLLVNRLDWNNIELLMKQYNYSDVVKLDLNSFKTAHPETFHEENLKLIKTRFQNGKHECYGIFHNDKLIYSTWISTDKIVFNYPVNKTIAIKSNQAILEGSYCHPDFRGRGLHSKMNIFRLKRILEMGITEAIVIVVAENRPALKTQIKSGFHKEKRIRIYNFLGKTYYSEKDFI